MTHTDGGCRQQAEQKTNQPTKHTKKITHAHQFSIQVYTDIVYFIYPTVYTELLCTCVHINTHVNYLCTLSDVLQYAICLLIALIELARVHVVRSSNHRRTHCTQLIVCSPDFR